MYNHNDYTYIQQECQECKNTPLIRDNVRQETYCPVCGLIVDNLSDSTREDNDSIKAQKNIQSITKSSL